MKVRITDHLKHLFGIHKYFYVKRLSNQSHMIQCVICNKKFSINTLVMVIVPWDKELEDFHIRKGHIKERE